MVRENGPRLLAVARRITGLDDEARDCVQETFMQLLRKVDAFEERSLLSTWLHRICVNNALGKLRDTKRRAEDQIDDLMPEFNSEDCRIEPHPNNLSTEQLLERNETRRLVRRAIANLPEQHATVLILRDIEGYNTAEVAGMLETTEGAVKTRLHRARSALKRLLEPLFRETAR